MVAKEDLRDASDARLVVGIGRFREDALAEAYRRHGGAVFALSRRLTGERALAEEVVQEVFLRLWNEPDRFDPERGSLRSYLLAHAHGRSVDLIRAETSRRNREERDARTRHQQDTQHQAHPEPPCARPRLLHPLHAPRNRLHPPGQLTGQKEGASP